MSFGSKFAESAAANIKGTVGAIEMEKQVKKAIVRSKGCASNFHPFVPEPNQNGIATNTSNLMHIDVKPCQKMDAKRPGCRGLPRQMPHRRIAHSLLIRLQHRELVVVLSSPAPHENSFRMRSNIPHSNVIILW